MESVLLDAAGHRRSPATMPGYHQGRAPSTKASATRSIRPRSRRSSPSCALPAAVRMGHGCVP
jgi:hypothetical protein